MTDTTTVRIALEGARELELEVEDGDAIAKALEEGLADGGIVWVADSKGNRHGINIDKLAFVEVQGEEHSSGVGFAAQP